MMATFLPLEQAILQEIVTQDLGLEIIQVTVARRAKLVMVDAAAYEDTIKNLYNAPISQNGWTLLHYAVMYANIR